MFRKPTTVCANGWSVGVTTGHGIDGARLSIFRTMNGNWRTQLQPIDGMMFATSDEAYDWSLAHGYTQVYYKRPIGFISLRLSPATRCYLKAMPAEKRLMALRRIFDQDLFSKDYFKAVCFASYMAETRARWNHYMETGEELNNWYHMRKVAA